MKLTSLSFGRGGERSGSRELSWRRVAAFSGWRSPAERSRAGRTIEFALPPDSLWRIAGNVRGVRIDCRQGRLWLTQAGAFADVILRPGQRFVAHGGGAIVVQSVASANDAIGSLTMPGAAARLQVPRVRAAAETVRIGMDRTERDPSEAWEHWAFLAVWLCSAFSVWYCLKSALSLPWTQ